MRHALVLIVAACGEAMRGEPSIDLDQPAAWKLAREEWIKVVSDPFRGAYEDYVRAFDAALPALEVQIRDARAAGKSRLMTRQHYAGDPQLTRGQARARWALPVQAPAQVALLDEVPLDAVFVRAGDAYKALVGIDTIVIDRTRALDATCARYLETLGEKTCQTIGWEIADAALRGDKARLGHSCSIAKGLCTSQ
ncbi:MAG: hypothetical protein ACKV2T_10755 [Kofleriaceae bacterium]